MTEVAHRFEDGAGYERFMGQWSRAIGAAFIDWLAVPPGACWLDLGCGTGVFTALVIDRCSPARVIALDPAEAQIAHARRQPMLQRAEFHTADAQALPFADATFDIVAAALVMNFIPDPPCALAEMRRVARPGAVVAGYVWDFSQERSPSWPLRLGLRACGHDVPDVPGTRASTLDALSNLFRSAGLEDVATTSIEVTQHYADFPEFWDAQTPSYSPTTRMIVAMATAERERLREATRARLPSTPDGRISYCARANAIKGRAPRTRITPPPSACCG
jgi:ubiquinone/menaquinone biosynthesis C-methylase UbiE